LGYKEGDLLLHQGLTSFCPSQLAYFTPFLDPFLPLNWPPKKAKNKNYKGERVRRRRRECEEMVKV